jgi:hypothetical protein
LPVEGPQNDEKLWKSLTNVMTGTIGAKPDEPSSLMSDVFITAAVVLSDHSGLIVSVDTPDIGGRPGSPDGWEARPAMPIGKE